MAAHAPRVGQGHFHAVACRRIQAPPSGAPGGAVPVVLSLDAVRPSFWRHPLFSRSNLLFFLYCLLAMTFALPASAADAASASATATATATASAPAAPAAPAADPAPFGTNLFQGHFSQSSTSKVIQSGDRLIMRLWGGRTMDDILTVDPEGMITIPDVGRVPVAGLPIDAKEPLRTGHPRASSTRRAWSTWRCISARWTPSPSRSS